MRVCSSILWSAVCALLVSVAVSSAEEPEQINEVNPETERTNPVVIIKTNKGDITIELFEEAAPLTVANFLAYVDKGHYSDTIFHRVIPGFMIQGGGFDASMSQKPTDAPIKNEATNRLANERGTLAMARTSEVDSATSQFFINLVDNAFLNHSAPNPRGYGYCVFGRVTDGMDVVDEIARVRTGRSGPHSDVPTETITILEAVRP
jgi:peptidyl-prolyl cis-trans isomerase B (cyclophilin B)